MGVLTQEQHLQFETEGYCGTAAYLSGLHDDSALWESWIR